MPVPAYTPSYAARPGQVRPATAAATWISLDRQNKLITLLWSIIYNYRSQVNVPMGLNA